jgi:D-glycero-alpha-D-manno-heptose 1-phosphate guanylyltransferase
MRTEEAIVLAGGRGTRLQSLVSDVPKPLAPVAGRPFLAWVLDHLAANGIRRVILATGYMSERIEQAIGREWQSMAVEYSVETSALGTGGAVRQARDRLLGGSAHILNGDTFLRYGPALLEEATHAAATQIGVALAQVEDVSRYGAVVVCGGLVRRFEEKGGSGPGLINAGSYFLTRTALDGLPDRLAFSLETEVLQPQAAAGAIAGFAGTTDFIDIGVPLDYGRAQQVFAVHAQ